MGQGVIRARVCDHLPRALFEFCSLCLLGTVPQCFMGSMPNRACGRNQGERPKNHCSYSLPAEPLATHDHCGCHNRRQTVAGEQTKVLGRPGNDLTQLASVSSVGFTGVYAAPANTERIAAVRTKERTVW